MTPLEYHARLAGLWAIAQFAATVPVDELQHFAVTALPPAPERDNDLMLLQAFGDLQEAFAAAAPRAGAVPITAATPHPAAECAPAFAE